MHRILIAGLGNPGQKYKHTRHNMGFMVLDRIIQDRGLSFKEDARGPQFASAEANLHGTRAIFIKPLEYMNRSGPPVARVRAFYRIPLENILAVHDDLDIELGKMKFIRSGGPGGHNGVRSMIEALGTRAFPRLKTGIDRPPPEIAADRYVLGRFPREQMPFVERVIETAAEAVLSFIEQGLDEAMNRFNGIVIT